MTELILLLLVLEVAALVASVFTGGKDWGATSSTVLFILLFFPIKARFENDAVKHEAFFDMLINITTRRRDDASDLILNALFIVSAS